ncbi:MAG: hypothetical protein CM1200mP35_06280 [Chloroflexota bacterium]|nr:MAG: hypothetical protein CM1200mP35_06280 [Chloroflexota bacterium]
MERIESFNVCWIRCWRTNTDAVLMGGTELLNKIKVSTTPDVTWGIVSALEQLLVGTDVNSVSSVMLGTTHFTNALLEQKGLSPTAVVRLCLPALNYCPLVDWPSDLKSTIGGVTYMVSGGMSSTEERYHRLILVN